MINKPSPGVACFVFIVLYRICQRSHSPKVTNDQGEVHEPYNPISLRGPQRDKVFKAIKTQLLIYGQDEFTNHKTLSRFEDLSVTKFSKRSKPNL